MSRQGPVSRKLDAEPSDFLFDVMVEIPKGSRHKYEFDRELHQFRLTRVLSSSDRYPADYGSIVGTIGGDRDPLDAFVILDNPTFPGCFVRCRAVALLDMTDSGDPDAKILALPDSDDFLRWRDVADIPRSLLDDLAHFLRTYQDVEPGKNPAVGRWRNRAQAERAIARAQRQFEQHHAGA